MGATDGHLGVSTGGHLVFAPDNANHLAFDCGAAGCPDDDPAVDVTLTWTDADTTKDFLGHTFTNGQTISMCPETHTCVASSGGGPSPFRNARERWRYSFGQTGQMSFYANYNYGFVPAQPFPGPPVSYTNMDRTNSFTVQYDGQPSSLDAKIAPDAHYSHRIFSATNSTTNDVTSNLSTQGVHASDIQVNGTAGIPDEFFSQYTTNQGLTIAWARGAGTWGC